MDQELNKKIKTNGKKVALVTLGCPKNEVDTGVLAGELKRGGLELVPSQEDADVILINTCGFIEDAKKESIDAILRAVELKKNDGERKVYVWGCLSERYKNDIMLEIPEVNGFFGVESYEKIGKALLGTSYRWQSNAHSGRLLSTPSHTAYLKIADGCDHRCTFCAIPMIKGKTRSRSIENLVEEVNAFADRGVKELHLIAQDTTAYGKDLAEGVDIVRLLRELSAIDGIEWIRLMYAHPSHVTDSMIELIADTANICAYLDLPLQHAADSILKRMGRGLNRDGIENLISRLRQRIPGLVLRTAFIVGFPGETDDLFDDLLTFIEEQRFERLGAFVYSPEEGTEAFAMEPTVPVQTAEERYDILMRKQQDISSEINRTFIGKTIHVLVDGYDEEEALFYGRTEGDALEIDQTVWIRGHASVGDFIDISIDAVSSYDLMGTRVGDREMR